MLTWAISGAIVGLFAAVLLLGDGYLRAWTVAIMLAILLLYVLSIPRYIKVNTRALEVHCVVEMVRIPIEDVRSVRRLMQSEMRGFIPLLGSYGFFGYYGYYADLRRWEIIKVYATEWDNLVEIEDIYENIYIISCRERERLIELFVQAKLAGAGMREQFTPRRTPSGRP
jgi:hypothetical protein